MALERGCRDIHIRGDSNLVIQQIRGGMNVHAERLGALCRTVREKLLPAFDCWEAQHVGREENDVADGLAGRAIEDGRYGDIDQRRPSVAEGCWTCFY